MYLFPVKRYPEPAFPTRAALEADAELLRLTPKRWQGQAMLATALALSGLFSAAATRADGAETSAAPSVAPIFPSHMGRAVYGTTGPMPQIFLAEDEARQIIREEAEKAGVQFAATETTVEKIPISVRNAGGRLNADGTVTDYFLPAAFWKDEADAKPAMIKEYALTLDGADTKRKIAFEFISAEDYATLWYQRKLDGRNVPTPETILGTANALRDGLAAQQHDGIYAVFYDPSIGHQDVEADVQAALPESPDYDTLRVATRDRAKAVAADELRKQVRDFIQWLKASGSI